MFRVNNSKENSTRIKAFDGDLWRSRVLILQGWKCAQRARGMCAWQAPGSLETWRKWRYLGKKGKFLGADKIDPDAPLLSGFSLSGAVNQKASPYSNKQVGNACASPRANCPVLPKFGVTGALRRDFRYFITGWLPSAVLTKSFWMVDKSFWKR